MRRLLVALGILVAIATAQPALAATSSDLQGAVGGGQTTDGGAPTTSAGLLQSGAASLQTTDTAGQAGGDAQSALQQVGGQDAYKLFVGSDPAMSQQEPEPTADTSGPSPLIWAAGLVAALLVLGTAVIWLVRGRRVPATVLAEEPIETEETTNPEEVTAEAVPAETVKAAAKPKSKAKSSKKKRKTKR